MARFFTGKTKGGFHAIFSANYENGRVAIFTDYNNQDSDFCDYKIKSDPQWCQDCEAILKGEYKYK